MPAGWSPGPRRRTIGESVVGRASSLRGGNGLAMNWRWLPWLLVVGVWTWALLLPNPGDWARALILPDEVAAAGDHPVRQQLLTIVLSFLFSKALHVLGYALLAALSGWL